KKKQVSAINGSGRSPRALTLDHARTAHPEIPLTGRLPSSSPHAITVPGAVQGWSDTLSKFGTKSFTEALAPAIELAESGFPVSAFSAWQWGKAASRLLSVSPNGFEMLVPDATAPGGYRAPKEGEMMRNGTLAATLRSIASDGARDGFYRGRIGQAIVDAVGKIGGTLSLDDLSNHTSTFEPPVSTEYAGMHLWECAPNGQGLVAVLALAILRTAHEVGVLAAPLEDAMRAFWANDHHHPLAVPVPVAHVLTQALAMAFADAQARITDPECVPPSAIVGELLAPGHLTVRARLLVVDASLAGAVSESPKAAATATLAAPRHSSDTVYLTTADAEGNACSFIFSNYMGFGNGTVPAGCGFTLQNRGCNFDLDPSAANVLAPNKRPYHTIIPAMLTRPTNDQAASELVAAYGVMGGFMQPQGHVQVLLHWLARGGNGSSPQLAMDAPRLCIQPIAESTDRAALVVDVEDGLFGPGDATDAGAAELQRMLQKHDTEHVVTVRVVRGAARALFGRGQWIGKLPGTPSSGWVGASDGRADGCAFGW
ncbi:gamma-glutamyltranspeptidase, partial [Blastocladiella britannica]